MPQPNLKSNASPAPPHPSISQSRQKSKGKSQNAFIFVPTTGRIGDHRDARVVRSMRAHVMHNYLDKQQYGEKTRPQPVAGEKMRFRLRSDGLERRYPYRYRKKRPNDSPKPSETEQPIAPDTTEIPSLPTSPLIVFGNNRIDPLNVLPFSLSREDEVFVDRFHHVQRWPWCPINGQNIWSPFALSNELVFHATVYSWSMHFSSRMMTGRTEWLSRNPAVIEHKVAAIALINNHLSRSELTSDTVLAAVTAITNTELVFGSEAEAVHHMKGLQALVAMRGGIWTLSVGIQQLLQRLISWNDLVCSELYGTPLRFPPIELWDRAWQTNNPPSIGTSPRGLSPAELRAAGLPNHEVFDAIQAIRQLCQAERDLPLTSCTDRQRMQRGDMLHPVERRLRVMLQSTDEMQNIWRAIALTALIYAHHWLRGNGLKYRVFATLVIDLESTLLSMTPELQELSFSAPLLVWIRVVGAVASEHLFCHSWYLDRLAETCSAYGMVWQSFRWTLQDFAWVGEKDELRYWNLWQKVQTRMDGE